MTTIDTSRITTYFSNFIAANHQGFNMGTSKKVEDRNVSLELVAMAQHKLNTVPDASEFWDTELGQTVLDLQNEFGLEPTTTDATRIALSYNIHTGKFEH